MYCVMIRKEFEFELKSLQV